MPSLQDKIYGKMEWQFWTEDEYDEDVFVWFSRMKMPDDNEFMLAIRAASAMDFLAPRNTHLLFEKYLQNLPEIGRQALDFTLKNSKLFAKHKHRNQVSNIIGQKLKLFSMEFFEDLSCEISFETSVLEENDSMLNAFFDGTGQFIEAYFLQD